MEGMSTKDLLIEYDRLTVRYYMDYENRDLNELEKQINKIRAELYKRADKNRF